MSLIFLNNSQINKTEWDRCIKEAENSLIYAHSFYLDIMCAGWHAITGENYSWVMPLTTNKKFGISYLYQPAFTQQSGVFFKKGVTPPYQAILQWLTKHYRYGNMQWNYANRFIASAGTGVEEKTNYIIDLSKGYTPILKGYHLDLLKNLKRSYKYKLQYAATGDFKQCINWYKNNYGDRMPHVTDEHYERFTQMATIAYSQQNLFCRSVQLPTGEVVAAALFLFDGTRIYNIMNTTLAGGKKIAANHYLLDSVIREFAGKKMVFDFEGSDLPGVKSFYRNFGGKNQPYYFLRFNNLPWPIRLFKR